MNWKQSKKKKSRNKHRQREARRAFSLRAPTASDPFLSLKAGRRFVLPTLTQTKTVCSASSQRHRTSFSTSLTRCGAPTARYGARGDELSSLGHVLIDERRALLPPPPLFTFPAVRSVRAEAAQHHFGYEETPSQMSPCPSAGRPPLTMPPASPRRSAGHNRIFFPTPERAHQQQPRHV